MTFLLDTNAISEPGRKQPNVGFLAWYETLHENDLFLSVVTLGELRRGLSRLPMDARRSRLERLYGAIKRRFGSQILPVDARVAETWGELSAALFSKGQIVGAPDELIAATALAHDLTVVTRNTRHFEGTGCRLLSPWTA